MAQSSQSLATPAVTQMALGIKGLDLGQCLRACKGLTLWKQTSVHRTKTTVLRGLYNSHNMDALLSLNNGSFSPPSSEDFTDASDGCYSHALIGCLCGVAMLHSTSQLMTVPVNAKGHQSPAWSFGASVWNIGFHKYTKILRQEVCSWLAVQPKITSLCPQLWQANQLWESDAWSRQLLSYSLGTTFIHLARVNCPDNPSQLLTNRGRICWETISRRSNSQVQPTGYSDEHLKKAQALRWQVKLECQVRIKTSRGCSSGQNYSNMESRIAVLYHPNPWQHQYYHL